MRRRAKVDGDFVVLLIGMRMNRPWKVHRWLPVYRAMGRMLSELAVDPELGLLRWERGLLHGPMVVQYWRSREHLDRFARGELHLPAARDFNRRLGAGADVGVWHEAYEVRAGAYEADYTNMPVFGLAAAAQST
jgi:fumigallin biosynthesis monooxygenase-like protein